MRRRGLVTGIFAASTATGQLIFLPGLIALISSGGWRSGIAVMAAVIWPCLSSPISLALFTQAIASSCFRRLNELSASARQRGWSGYGTGP